MHIHLFCTFPVSKAVEAVTTQGVETLADTTSSIGKGITKSIRKQSDNAHTLVREVADCVDTEDLLKALRRLGGKEDIAVQKNQQYVVHTPIDWAKFEDGDNDALSSCRHGGMRKMSHNVNTGIVRKPPLKRRGST